MQKRGSIYSAFDRIYRYQDELVKTPAQKLNEDLVTLIQKMKTDGYTEEEIKLVTTISVEELEIAATVVIAEAAMKGITKSDKPTLYHVAGQPGCGKSVAIKTIESSLKSSPFISEMDIYRTKHPRITQIKEIINKKYPNDLQIQGKEFVSFTSLFADVLELSVISYMISRGYSVIKETTGKNSENICGMIAAFKNQYPYMTASIACMAVAKEVSIDGTLIRGSTMNHLTAIFAEDLKKIGIAITPVDRGNVSRKFSEDICNKIPESMANIANSGLIDGEFLITKRGNEDSVVIKINGDECKSNSNYIKTILQDRITGQKAKEEEEMYFCNKDTNKKQAVESLENGNIDPLIDFYLYSAKTWLKETDGALDFYIKESGLNNVEDVERWIVKNKMLPELLNDYSDMSVYDSKSPIDNIANLFNKSGQKLCDASGMLDVDDFVSMSK